MEKYFSLTNRYIPAIIILAILATINFLANEYKVDMLKEHGKIINKSGKQRMISQKSLLLAHMHSTHNTKNSLLRLEDILSEMKEANTFLTSGVLTQDLQTIYFEDGLKNDVIIFIEELQNYIKNPKKESCYHDKKLDKFLSKLDKAVSMHEEAYNDDISMIRYIELSIYLGLLTTLLLLVFFIFIPTSRLIDLKTKEQENLLSLFNKGEVVLFRWNNDEKWSVDFASDNSSKLLGYTKEQFMTQQISYDSIIDKDDIPKIHTEIYEAIKQDEDFFTHQPYRIKTENGTIKWVLNNTLIIRDADKNITHFLGYISDITELKTFEIKLQKEKERFDLAIHSSKDGLWDWNIQTKEIFISETLKNIHGYEKNKSINSIKEWAKNIHQNDIKKVFMDIKLHLKNKTPIYESTHRIKHTDGHWVWVSTRGKALFNEKNRPYRMIGFQTDISLQKRYENDLKELVKEKTSENMEQHKLIQHQLKIAQMGEMIGAIAHQWRQPLNTVSTSIQSLKYDYREGRLKNEEYILDFIDINKKNMQFMSKTIDDFRNFFRIDKAKVYFNIKESVQTVIDMKSFQLTIHHIAINFKGDELIYYGYQGEFQQVIFNLINNAEDALVQNKIKSPMINISLNKYDKILSIKDNAGGIPDNIIERIFEPYFTTKEQGKGTGMGLYMSKKIIEDNMGASLRVKNIGDGAVFTMNFNKSSII